MKLYEYQAKEILKRAGIAVPAGCVAYSAVESAAVFRETMTRVAVKAQVHTGGRGKAGGVKLASTEDETVAAASAILGMEIKGFRVDRVLIERALEIDLEYYVGLTLDRAARSIVLIASADGGVEIEETAKKAPDRIHRIPIDPYVGLKDYHLQSFLHQVEGGPAVRKAVASILKTLYTVVLKSDATLLEVNPLVVTREGLVVAADAKMEIDDNALDRQKEIAAQNADAHGTEDRAKLAGLSYIKMDGNIGCVVNGAGLAMATMDLIKLYCGAPANFLDIGGSSNPGKVKAAMELLLSDGKVKVAFFNIFGGITRCDDVASGILQAMKELKVSIPVIIRLTGTNEGEARKMLADAGFSFEESMSTAARKAVEAVR